MDTCNDNDNNNNDNDNNNKRRTNKRKRDEEAEKKGDAEATGAGTLLRKRGRTEGTEGAADVGPVDAPRLPPEIWALILAHLYSIFPAGRCIVPMVCHQWRDFTAEMVARSKDPHWRVAMGKTWKHKHGRACRRETFYSLLSSSPSAATTTTTTTTTTTSSSSPTSPPPSPPSRLRDWLVSHVVYRRMLFTPDMCHAAGRLGDAEFIRSLIRRTGPNFWGESNLICLQEQAYEGAGYAGDVDAADGLPRGAGPRTRGDVHRSAARG